MKLLLNIGLIEEFNAILKNKGLPMVNWVVTSGAKKEHPKGTPRNTREVVWDTYKTIAWGDLHYFEPLRNKPTWINPATGAEFPGVIIYEFFYAGGPEWPGEYIAVVAKPCAEEEVKAALREFIEKSTPK